MAVDLALDASLENLAVASAEAVVAACYIRLGRGFEHVAALCQARRIFGDEHGSRRRQRGCEDKEAGKEGIHGGRRARALVGQNASRQERV